MTAPGTERPGRPRSGSRLLLLLLVPGLVVALVAAVLWAWPDASPRTPAATTPATTVATPTPDPTEAPTAPGTPATSPTPTGTPTDTPATPPADPETFTLDMNTEYAGGDTRFLYAGTGVEDGVEYAFLVFGPPPDGERVKLVADEPYRLPDGRWLYLQGIGEDESAGFLITAELL